MNLNILRCIVIGLSISLPHVAHGDERQPRSGLPERVIVLQNGRVLSGQIVRVGEQLEVRGADGSLVRVPVGQVALEAPDLVTAFEIKASRLSGGLDGLRRGPAGRPPADDTPERTALIGWCLNNDLLSQAAFQVAVLRSRERPPANLDYLTRRLNLAIAAKNARLPDTGSNPQQSQRSSRPQMVVSAGELQRFAKGLPKESVTEFRYVVQPIVINRCGAVACHGVRSENGYRLVRPTRATAFSHRYTQRNLYETVTQIRRSELERTKWFRALSGAHGGANTALFSADDAGELQKLVAWAQALSKAPRALPSDATKGTAAIQVGPRTESTTDRAVRPASFVEGLADPVTEPAGASKAGAAKVRAIGWETPTAKPAPSKDPFDPETYNQKYFPAAKPAPKPGL